MGRRYIVDRPCPALSEALARALVEVGRGEEFEILTKWEAALEDVRSWAALFNSEIMGIERNDEWLRIVIRRN